jgi:diguanylate cyclase (GGDEF)-like protein
MNPHEPSQRNGIEWLPESHRSLRIKQMLYAVESGVLILIAIGLTFGAAPGTIPILVTAAVALLGMIALLRLGYVMTASYLTLGMMTLACSLLMWLNAGLRDTSLLGFTAILYFTTVVGSRTLFYGYLAYVIAFFTMVGAFDVLGWRSFTGGSQLNWVNVGDVLILTGIVAFTMKLLSDDLRNVLKGLETENRNAREAEESARYHSQHDGLTGLPNRVLGEDRFMQALGRTRRIGGKVAVLFVDIDHFKTFNDTLGHALGDALICEIGERIRGAVRAVDSVCRYGGNEFIVILDALPSRDWAETCARKILATILHPIHLGEHQLEVTVSVGIAIAPDDGADYHNICRKADMAMYKSKEFGRNTVRYYNEQMNRESEQKMQLISGLRQALRNGEFQLHYQPQVRLADGVVTGAEALIRWVRRDGEIVYPDTFIPVAEETRLIRDIGRWVINEACRQCAAWHKQGFDTLSVAVNVSAIQLESGELVDDVSAALSENGLGPEHLVLELTESTLIDNDIAVRAELSRLYHLGIHLSIDDFGTGYSNLEYLSRLETGSIKIDKSFVVSRSRERQKESIVVAIIQLAGSLGLSTIAEGVEDPQTMQRLQELGCERGQGHYWAAAMPAADFSRYMREKTGRGVLKLFPKPRESSPGR